MITRTLLRAVGLMVLLSGVAIGQENLPAPSQAGAYDLFGNLKVGYRVVSINPGDQTGDWFQSNAENLVREEYQLTDSGFALGRQLPVTFNLFGARRAGEDGFFDQIFLNADINPTVMGGSLRLRSFGAYDFKVDYRKTNYYYNRYDSIYQDLRVYDSDRNDLTADLTVSATDFLDVNLNYRGIGHGGTIRMPRNNYVEGVGAGPGRAFAAYYWLAELPRTDFNSTFSGSLNAAFDMISVTVGGGTTSYTEDYAASPVPGDGTSLNYLAPDSVPNQFGIIGDVPAPGGQRERLIAYDHTETREMSGPFFFGQLVATPVDMLSITADVRMDWLEGTTDVKLSQRGEINRRVSNRLNAYDYDGITQGTIVNELNRLTASAVATVTPIPELSVNAGWKMSSQETKSHTEYDIRFGYSDTLGSGNFGSIFPDSVHPGNVLKMDWRQRMYHPRQTIFGGVTVVPMNDLTLNAGVSLNTLSPDATRFHEGEFDSVLTRNMSKEVSSLGLNFGAMYRILPELRVRARYEMLDREAKFIEDSAYTALRAEGGTGGPAPGTVTDLEPRLAPEKVNRITASLDWKVMQGMKAGLRLLTETGTADLSQSMFVKTADTNVTEYNSSDMSISGTLSYVPDENIDLRLMAEYGTNEWSIPMTWTRGQKLPFTLFDPLIPQPSGTNEPDSATVWVRQTTNNLYLDLGAGFRAIPELLIGAGVSFLSVEGVPSTTPEVQRPSATPNGEGDVTRTGDPFTRTTFRGNVGYDITPQFGVGVDVFYAMLGSEALDNAQGASFYGINDYNGLSATINLLYNF